MRLIELVLEGGSGPLEMELRTATGEEAVGNLSADNVEAYVTSWSAVYGARVLSFRVLRGDIEESRWSVDLGWRDVY